MELRRHAAPCAGLIACTGERRTGRRKHFGDHHNRRPYLEHQRVLTCGAKRKVLVTGIAACICSALAPRKPARRPAA
ncbi:hypothetical protein SHIRM173S_08088 [Streptomyces hirsutus]